MNRRLVFDLATCAFIVKREDALFPGPGGTGKSHLAQAIRLLPCVTLLPAGSGNHHGNRWIGGQHRIIRGSVRHLIVQNPL